VFIFVPSWYALTSIVKFHTYEVKFNFEKWWDGVWIGGPSESRRTPHDTTTIDQKALSKNLVKSGHLPRPHPHHFSKLISFQKY